MGFSSRNPISRYRVGGDVVQVKVLYDWEALEGITCEICLSCCKISRYAKQKAVRKLHGDDLVEHEMLRRLEDAGTFIAALYRSTQVSPAHNDEGKADS